LIVSGIEPEIILAVSEIDPWIDPVSETQPEAIVVAVTSETEPEAMLIVPATFAASVTTEGRTAAA
jgi:hypothetical protein